MRKSVRKKLIIILIIVAVILVGILIYNYYKKGVLFAPETNIILNPDFESWSSTTLSSWSAPVGGVLSKSSDKINGLSSLQIQRTGYGYVTGQNFNVQPGETYYFEIYIKKLSGSVAWARVVDPAKWQWQSFVSQYNNNAWQKFSQTVTIPQGVTQIRLELGGSNMNALYDGAVLLKTSTSTAPITASWNNNAVHPITHAIDNNINTYYMACSTPGGAYNTGNVIYDLGAIKTLTQINLDFNQWNAIYPGAPASQYSVSISNDKSSWTNVYNNPYTVARAPDVSIPINNLQGRYIKLEYTKVNDGTGWCLALNEIGVEKKLESLIQDIDEPTKYQLYLKSPAFQNGIDKIIFNGKINPIYISYTVSGDSLSLTFNSNDPLFEPDMPQFKHSLAVQLDPVTHLAGKTVVVDKNNQFVSDLENYKEKIYELKIVPRTSLSGYAVSGGSNEMSFEIISPSIIKDTELCNRLIYKIPDMPYTAIDCETGEKFDSFSQSKVYSWLFIGGYNGKDSFSLPACYMSQFKKLDKDKGCVSINGKNFAKSMSNYELSENRLPYVKDVSGNLALISVTQGYRKEIKIKEDSSICNVKCGTLTDGKIVCPIFHSQYPNSPLPGATIKEGPFAYISNDYESIKDSNVIFDTTTVENIFVNTPKHIWESHEKRVKTQLGEGTCQLTNYDYSNVGSKSYGFFLISSTYTEKNTFSTCGYIAPGDLSWDYPMLEGGNSVETICYNDGSGTKTTITKKPTSTIERFRAGDNIDYCYFALDRVENVEKISC